MTKLMQGPDELGIELFLEGDPVLLDHMEARKVEGLLDVGAKVNHVGNHLHMGLRLVVATHDPKRQDGLLALEQHGRDDGVQGALARRHAVGVSWVDNKPSTTVLQHDAGVGHGNSRAERKVEATDHGYDVSFRVGHGEVNGVALGGKLASRGASYSPLGVQQCCPALRVVLR
ncbi:hypothetical protein HRbin30_02263 [bacterium HR30]|nr:hypothetical protein HRbin30_02263 [bacterium HR30]